VTNKEKFLKLVLEDDTETLIEIKNRIKKRMEKTAVDWLVEQILKEKGLVDLDIEIAKEIEKQQIIDAYIKNRYIDTSLSTPIRIDEAEQYYKEKFNK